MSDYGFPDLAFDRHEVAGLLQSHGVECGEDSVDDLLSATEGWAAAVYLAVLAWRSGDLSAQPLPSGDRRQIADYLTAEVLAGQSSDMVQFLTRTSLVPQLCPELCVELTGRDDSARAARGDRSARTCSCRPSTIVASGTATITCSVSFWRRSSGVASLTSCRSFTGEPPPGSRPRTTIGDAVDHLTPRWGRG